MAQPCDAACTAGLHSAAAVAAAASHAAPLAAAGLASAGHTNKKTHHRNVHSSILTYKLAVMGDAAFGFLLYRDWKLTAGSLLTDHKR